ncbi:hypothetical protein DFH09DRAFT_1420920, partial [Mycena vulgaris]
GRACFIVEGDANNRSATDTHVPGTCSKCNPVVFLDPNGQRVLEHMGGHILFDPSLENQQPCGLCNHPSPMCTFFFTKRRGTKTARQIDWTRSTCSNPIHFNMKTATSFTTASPCTNVPILCSHCDLDSSLVWTYNLKAHYAQRHNRLTGPYTYLVSDAKGVVSHVEYTVSAGERRLVLERWTDRFIASQKQEAKTSTKSTERLLPISEAHSSRMALQNTLETIPEEEPTQSI